MKKLYLLLIIVFILNINCFTQTTPIYIKYFDKSYFKNIEINQDSETTRYLQSYAGFNKKNNGIMGYRIKIYSQNNALSRNQSNEVKSQFETQFHGHKAYRIYNNPNFEVFVGDFVDRFSAMAFLLKINKKYPRAYIVQSYISVSKIDTEETSNSE